MLMQRQRNVRSQACAGARTLYLGEGGQKWVSCNDMALVVKDETSPEMRYPVARVARIVSSVRVDWRGSALALCMQAGITISWVTTNGAALGTCLASQPPADAAVALETLLESDAGLDRYWSWLRHRRMAVLVRWAEGSSKRIAPHQWETLKREWVYAGHLAQHLPERLRPLVLAYVQHALGQHRLTRTVWGPQAQAIELDQDLVELLWGEMNLYAGNLMENLQQQPDLVALAERWIGANAATCTQHLYSLQRCALKALRDD